MTILMQTLILISTCFILWRCLLTLESLCFRRN
jgi:hypothetical protein